MTINYTTLLGLAQPVTGTEQGTWGTVVNDEITALIEEAIAGGETIDVTAGNVTLTDTDGVANQARNAILIITGTPGTSRNVVAPSTSKVYIVINGSDGAVVLKGAATTGVTIAAGSRSLVAWNGSDFVEVGQAGDVDGPASSTDTAIVRFSGTSGKIIQNSGVTIDGSNNVSGVAQLNATTADLTNIEVTNIKAKDGTASASIADSTGIFTHSTATVFPAGTSSSPSITTTGDLNTGIFFPAADTIAFAEGGAEAMRLDSSGNVLIGTTSVLTAGKLSLLADLWAANSIVLRDSGTTYGYSSYYTLYQNSTGGTVGGIGHTAVTSLGINATTNLQLFTNATERARIDSSGNVGIGVTPSASNTPTLEVGTIGSGISGRAINTFSLAQNAYYNAGWKYAKGTYKPALHEMQDGNFYWYSATSGTAGNAITFTERMRIDSSGNVLVGTTSNSDSARIYADSGSGTTVASFNSTNSGTGGGGIRVSYNGTTELWIGYYQFAANTGTGVTDAGIGARGNLLLDGSTNTLFSTGGTERARITSGGYFKASNTGTYGNSTGGYHELRSNANGITAYISNSIASGYTDTLIQASFTGYTPNTTGAWFLYCNDTTNLKASILTTGTFESRTSTYGGVSDIKLKQDIVDASSQWNDIKNLRVRKFRFKDEVAVDPNYPSYIGLIAQEAELVSPGLVSETPDMEEVEVTDEEGNVTKERKPTGTVTKSVKYSILYMKAVKALQEAMTRIEALEAEVAALKAK